MLRRQVPLHLFSARLSLGLAPQAVERLSEAMLEINRNGISILLVERDILTAFELAKQAFVVESGKVMISGKTDDLADNADIRRTYMGM